MTFIKASIVIGIFWIIFVIFVFTTYVPPEIKKEEPKTKVKFSILEEKKKEKKINIDNILFVFFILVLILLFFYFYNYNYNYYFYCFHIKNVSNIYGSRNINFYFPYQHYITKSFYYKRYVKTYNKCYNFLHSNNLARSLFISFRKKNRKFYWHFRGQIVFWKKTPAVFRFWWNWLNKIFEIFIVIKSLFMISIICSILGLFFKLYKFLKNKFKKK